MKRAGKFLAVAAVAVGMSVLVSPTFAAMGRSGGGGGYYGGHYRGGWGWGGRGWWGPGWGFYAYAPWPYYYNYGYYYPYNYGYYYPPTTYYAPSVVYGSQATVDYSSPPPQPAAESPQEPAVDRPLSPTAVDRDSDSPAPPPPPPMAQRPPQIQRTDQGQSIGVADVKALAKAGLSDEVILSHLRNSQVVYHLTTAEIIDLKTSGVSEKIIDFMINTPSIQR